MKVLVAGVGSIGRRHLRNLRAAGVEDFVLLRSGRATLPDDELAGLPVVHNLDDVWAHEPNVAVISNPTALHLPVALECARHGCHLFLEKPVSHSLEGCDELVEEVSVQGVGALVGFHFRFNPGLRWVRELLKQGAVGRVVNVQVHWGEWLPGWHPWEDYRQGYAARADLGGGIVLTLSHPFDYLRFLLQDEVVGVDAHLGYNGGLEIEVEDTADVRLEFASGAVANVHLDYVQRPPSHTLQIIGTEGTIRWDNADASVQLWTASKGEWQSFPAPSCFERNAMFEAEMRHLLEVAGGAIPVCTLQDGLATQRITDAIFQSARSGLSVRLGEE